jgi:hypothetical protein
MTNLAKIDTSTQGHQLPADPMVSMIESGCDGPEPAG